MKKYIFIFLLSSCVTSEELILKDAEVTFANYKSLKPLPGREKAAATTSSIPGVIYTASRVQKYTVFYHFSESLSYVDPEYNSKTYEQQETLLRHERGHFILTILAAKKMKEAMMKIRAKTINKNVADSVAKLYLQEAEYLNQKYDIESANGTATLMQYHWDSMFLKEMKRLHRIRVDSIVIN